MVLKSAGAFPAPGPTVGLYGHAADLRHAKDAPQAASGVYSGHNCGLPFKDMLPLFSVRRFSYSGGLFLISPYVYGRLDASGQPGLGVCLFFFSVVSFLSLSFLPPTCDGRGQNITDLLFSPRFYRLFSTADDGQSDYVHAQVPS